jgi:GNAT superfamily N-acetyltransferase
MDNITYTTVRNVSDIDLLLGKTSQFQDFVYTYDADTIDLLKENFAMADSLYLFAQASEVFAGFVSCDRDWWEEDSFFLREIFVDPLYQGQGIGKTLACRCVEHAKQAGASMMVTQTAYENIPMQKLCEQLSFVPWDNPQWKAGITYKLPLK